PCPSYVDLAADATVSGISIGVGDDVVGVDSVQALGFSRHLPASGSAIPFPQFTDNFPYIQLVHAQMTQDPIFQTNLYGEYQYGHNHYVGDTDACAGQTRNLDIPATATPTPLMPTAWPPTEGVIQSGQVQTKTVQIDSADAVDFRL